MLNKFCNLNLIFIYLVVCASEENSVHKKYLKFKFIDF